VTVNGNVANRRGEYFHWPLAVNNSSAAQYPTLTVTSQYGSTQSDSGEVFVPYATESFSHDADGNLTSDGRWTYIWDGENRLIEMKRDNFSPKLSSRQRLVFEYDHQGRRIRKTFYTHNVSGWVEDTDTVFLYDGWNLMRELNASSINAKVRTYVWGLDLNGSEQGAGGVGGLLKVTDYTSGTTHHFVGYDGNGNVAALFDGTTGAATARYEYGPFGEPLRTTGTLAEKCPFRFSTKYTDNDGRGWRRTLSRAEERTFSRVSHISRTTLRRRASAVHPWLSFFRLSMDGGSVTRGGRSRVIFKNSCP
jgi:YD repeat-containing protein